MKLSSSIHNRGGKRLSRPFIAISMIAFLLVAMMLVATQLGSVFKSEWEAVKDVRAPSRFTRRKGNASAVNRLEEKRGASIGHKEDSGFSEKNKVNGNRKSHDDLLGPAEDFPVVAVEERRRDKKPDNGAALKDDRVRDEHQASLTTTDASVCGAALPSITSWFASGLNTQRHQKRESSSEEEADVFAVESDWVTRSQQKASASICSGGRAEKEDEKGTEKTTLTNQEERYKLCYYEQDRFLFFGNNWGRHSNQLTSLAAALVLGKKLNRTVIVPPLFPDHAAGKKSAKLSSPSASIELVDLYDISLLLDVRRSPFCVLSESEFYQLEMKTKDKRVKQHGSSSNLEVPSVCMTMRGIKTFPRQPRQFSFKCQGEVFVKFKKDLRLFLRTATSTVPATTTDSNHQGDALSSLHNPLSPIGARVLTVPLLIYYTPKVPLASTLCVWKLLQPHLVVGSVMDALRGEYGLASQQTGSFDSSSFSSSSASDGAAIAISSPSPFVVGIHMRSLEGSCDSRIDELEKHAAKQDAEMAAGDQQPNNNINKEKENKEFNAHHDSKRFVENGIDFSDFLSSPTTPTVAGSGNNAKQKRRDALTNQCKMESRYVLKITAESFSKTPKSDVLKNKNEVVQRPPLLIFIADDNQQPQRVEQLISALNAIHAVDDGTATNRFSSVKAYRLRNVFALKDQSADKTNAVDDNSGVSDRFQNNLTISSVLRRIVHADGSYYGARHERLCRSSSSSSSPPSSPYPFIRNRFTSFTELLFMQLDFWTLSSVADALVGNQLSTLSQNACRRRMAMGQKCDNFVGVGGV